MLLYAYLNHHPLPSAHHHNTRLVNGKLLVIYNHNQLFQIPCVSKPTTTVSTRVPADILELPTGFRAQSQNMAISPPSCNSSTVTL